MYMNQVHTCIESLYTHIEEEQEEEEKKKKKKR